MDNLIPEAQRTKVKEAGTLNVCEKRCDRCIFSRAPHVPWIPDGKAKIAATLRQGTHFGCHEFGNVMCRGFYDRHGEKLWYVKFAQRIGALRFIEKGQTV